MLQRVITVRVEQLCQLGNLLREVARFPSPAAEGPAPREVSPRGTTDWGSTAGQGHRSHLTRCHTWSPAITREAANIAGGGSKRSSCSPLWDRAPCPEVSIAAAQKVKLRKEFGCYIRVMTNLPLGTDTLIYLSC